MDSESEYAAMKACLDVVQKAAPTSTDKALETVKELVSSKPDFFDKLQQQILLPLKVSMDPGADNKRFLQCPCNRVGESYRSPWTNKFCPPLDLSLQDDMSNTPVETLRDLELVFSEVFDSYRQHYYGKEAVGSVYVYEKEGSSFETCFLLQKRVESTSSLDQGQWDSAHVCRVGPSKNGSANYELQSTVLVTMIPSSSPNDRSYSGSTSLSTLMSKQTTQSAAVGNAVAHAETIGKMIEDAEIELRSNMEMVHIPKTQQVLESIHKELSPSISVNPMMNHTAMLNQAVLARAALNKKTGSK